MRTILAVIVVHFALLLVIADVAQSTSDDTGEARCYHSPEKVRLYSISNDVAVIVPNTNTGASIEI